MNMIRLIVILAGLLHAGGVFAQKTDIVILENGDRITGEIKRLEAGLLNFSTDTMGTVNIEWRFIRPEEAMLRDRFPEAYPAYCARVRRWL